MAWDKIQADWQRYVGQVRILWTKLSEEDLNQIDGQRDMLIEMIHRRYKVPKDNADEQVKLFESQLDTPHFERDHPHFDEPPPPDGRTPQAGP
ncbi:MAG: general stress protein CsbD [Nitrococcus sp.]|nr:general stress protein CsbD [Nitrococcus sp.]